MDLLLITVAKSKLGTSKLWDVKAIIAAESHQRRQTGAALRCRSPGPRQSSTRSSRSSLSAESRVTTGSAATDAISADTASAEDAVTSRASICAPSVVVKPDVVGETSVAT